MGFLRGVQWFLFRHPPFKPFRFSLSVLFPKRTPTNSERFFIYPSQSLGLLVSIILLKKMISPSSITIGNAIAAIQKFGRAASVHDKKTLSLLFGSFQSIRTTGNFWRCLEMGSSTLTKCSHSGLTLPLVFLISCPIPLSEFCLTNV